MASGSGSGGQRLRVAVAEGPRQDLRKKKKKASGGVEGSGVAGQAGQNIRA